jgi:putative ABC transport system permease protein
MDLTVIAAALGVSLIAGILIGLVPVAQLVKVDLSNVLREESRTGTGGRKAQLLRRTLVVAQVAFTFVLLIGSGLLLASFRNLLSVDPGFKAKGVITFTASAFRACVTPQITMSARSQSNASRRSGACRE